MHVEQKQEGDLLIRSYRNSDHANVIALWREAFPDDPPWNNPDLVIRRKLAVQGELFLSVSVTAELWQLFLQVLTASGDGSTIWQSQQRSVDLVGGER